MGIPWTCPYCSRPCTIGTTDINVMQATAYISQEYGFYQSKVEVIVCPNPECRKQTISMTIGPYDAAKITQDKPIFSWRLLPESDAKPFPSYIPQAILDDYREACLIQLKSPKASATLSRRCLQGMIRDFWKISKSKLFDEIKELEDKVDTTTWKAIDSVRKVGNIGAHMEKDVNFIIDVDPEEAALLIWLIETLLEDWYIARYERETRMAKIVEVAQEKTQQKIIQGTQ